MNFSHIRSFIYSTVWCMLEARMEDIIEVIEFREGGGRRTREEIAEIMALDAASRERVAARQAADRRQKGVAVLPLMGIISPRIEQVNDISGPGGTSAQGFQRSLMQAVRDPEVGSILIDVDSPGGNVHMLRETAQAIREARKQKPITAIAQPVAASGAFWLAAQADELVVTPSGEVGSVGAFTMHRDISEREEKKGVKTTLISAGRLKTAGNSFEPLSKEARADMQKGVDEAMGMFVEDLAIGRNVDAKTVLSNFGEGTMVGAEEAVDRGMADRVATFDQVLGELRDGRAPGGAVTAPRVWNTRQIKDSVPINGIGRDLTLPDGTYLIDGQEVIVEDGWIWQGPDYTRLIVPAAKRDEIWNIAFSSRNEDDQDDPILRAYEIDLI